MQPLQDLFTQSPILAAVFVLGLAGIIIMVLWTSSKDQKYGSPAAKLEAQEQALDFQAHLNRGNELLAQYEFDKALAHFQEALKFKNTDATIHFKIGRIFLQKEDYRNAALAFKNVLNLNPNQVEAHYELARIFQLMNKPEDAHQELNKALSVNPDHEETIKLKIKIFEQQENYQAALPLLKKLVASGGRHHGSKYKIKYANFLNRLQLYEDALSEYQGLVELDSANRFVYLAQIGQIHFEMGHYKRAIEFFKEVLESEAAKLDSGKSNIDAAVLRSKMAASLCNEGVKLFQTGRCQEAVASYKEALMYDQENVDIHYNLGKAYSELKDINNAMHHFELAIGLNPDDVSAYYELAVLQDEKGLIKEAIRNYEHILTIEPKHLQAIFGVGTLYGVQGNFDKAIRCLSEAIRIQPEFTDALYNLGVALERQKNYNKASRMYEKVLRLDKNHEKARSNLAHLRHLKGQGA